MTKTEPLYSEWKVQQAVSIERHPIPEGQEFWVTEKLNGVRATYFEGLLIARSGRRIDGLDHILKCLHDTVPAGVVLDGELTLLDPAGMNNNEAFAAASGILHSDSPEKPEIGYTVFDCVPDFFNPRPKARYCERRRMMDMLPFSADDPVRVISVLYHGKDRTRVDELLEEAILEDKEGLVVNLNVPYLRTRHSGILKVKRFYTMDLPIVGYEEGLGRLSGTLGALTVAYKNGKIGVGTGFTDEERRDLWNRRDTLIGTLCEVRYKAITSDRHTGQESLQFPVFVRLREDKTDISYD